MTRTIWLYLRLRWGNRLRGLLRRLKEPKYLIGLLAGVAYFVFFVGLAFVGEMLDDEEKVRDVVDVAAIASSVLEDVARVDSSLAAREVAAISSAILAAAQPTSSDPDPLLASLGSGGEWLVALLVLFGFGSTLYGASDEAGLPFPKAELFFLMGAPISRRQLLQFWLWYQQPGLVFSSFFIGIMALWGGRGSFPAAWLLAFLGLNLLVAFMGCARQLTARGQARGWPRWTRSLPFGAVLIGVLAAVVGTFQPYAGEEPLAFFAAWVQREPLHSVLAPFRAAAAAFFAEDFASAAPAVLSVAGLWLTAVVVFLARPAPFEEASLKIAERIDVIKTEGWGGYRRLKARQKRERAGRRGPSQAAPVPFALAPTGWPALAIAWKNIIASGRKHRPRNLLLALLVAGGAGTALGESFVGTEVPPVAAGVVLYATLLLSLFSLQRGRYDLRLDIPFFPVLRSYPFTARQVLHGEVLGLSLVAWAYASIGLVGAAACLSGFPADPWQPIGWEMRGPVLLACLIAAAGASLSFVALENVITLVFPGWAQIGPQTQVGFTQFGVNIVGMVLRACAFGLALLPAGLAGALVYALAAALSGTWFWPAVPAALAFSGTIAVEMAIALRLVESTYDAFDIAGLRK